MEVHRIFITRKSRGRNKWMFFMWIYCTLNSRRYLLLVQWILCNGCDQLLFLLLLVVQTSGLSSVLWFWFVPHHKAISSLLPPPCLYPHVDLPVWNIKTQIVSPRRLCKSLESVPDLVSIQLQRLLDHHFAPRHDRLPEGHGFRSECQKNNLQGSNNLLSRDYN